MLTPRLVRRTSGNVFSVSSFRNLESALWLLALLCSFALAACRRDVPDWARVFRGSGSSVRSRIPRAARLVGLTWEEATSRAASYERESVLRRKAIAAVGSPSERSKVGPLRADAVIAMLAGRTDQALGWLSRAAELAPGNVVIANDLAAAHLDHAAANRPEDLLDALSEAERARRAAPTMPEARFNVALALQRLSLDQDAREEWRSDLKLEADPGWRREAQAHVAELDRHARRSAGLGKEALQRAVDGLGQGTAATVVARSPQFCREYAEGGLLPGWAEAEAGRQEVEAQRLIASARAVGLALAMLHGERMLADTIAGVDAAQSARQGDLQSLVRGFRAYGRGLILANKEGNFAAARPYFETAMRQLASAKSPFAGWAIFWTGLCAFQHHDYAEAWDLVHTLSRDIDRDRYPALHGRLLWLEGLIAIVKGDPTVAVTIYEAALADFRRIGETAYAARMAAETALGLDDLGRRDEAWRALYPALIEPITLDYRPSRYSICETAAWLAKADDKSAVALRFQNETVRLALLGGDAAEIVFALRGRAEVLASLGTDDAARHDLQQAREYFHRLKDTRVQSATDADLKELEARLAPSPEEALLLLDEVVSSFRYTSYHYRLAAALLARARVQMDLARIDGAEGDLQAAINEIEQQRGTIGDREERIAYLDRRGAIFDAMIDLQIEQRNRLDIAFRYSEQAKARVLLDWVRALPSPSGQHLQEPASWQSPQLTNIESVRRGLSPGIAVVEYAVLPGSLVAWVLHQNGAQVETVKVGAAALERLVRQASRQLSEHRLEDFAATQSTLFELLIRPVEQHLAATDRLVFVPDGPLHTLAFGGLRNRITGKYLIEDHICSVAPSVRLYLDSLYRDRPLAERDSPRVLAMVDPAFDHELFPALPRLPAATREVRSIFLFPGSLVLADGAATREAFLRQAPLFEIVHFGGHSLLNTDHPLLSQMLFATAPSEPARGILYAQSILAMRFRGTRLAVLASCSTAAGKISRTEGVESLARPFLAAGVPAVIASLWDVDDAVAAKFFDRFYGHLQESFDPAAALQRAQVESIAEGSSDDAVPWSWAAFELIGGNAMQP
jgi:CHAT domain-containing protein